MHTAEHEEFHPLARRFRFMRSEDTMIATLAAWSIGLVLFTVAGFYFGSIAGHDNHPADGLRHVDLNPDQLGLYPLGFYGAMPFAAGGLLLGLAFALWVTLGYVPKKLKELDAEHVPH